MHLQIAIVLVSGCLLSTLAYPSAVSSQPSTQLLQKNCLEAITAVGKVKCISSKFIDLETVIRNSATMSNLRPSLRKLSKQQKKFCSPKCEQSLSLAATQAKVVCSYIDEPEIKASVSAILSLQVDSYDRTCKLEPPTLNTPNPKQCSIVELDVLDDELNNSTTLENYKTYLSLVLAESDSDSKKEVSITDVFPLFAHNYGVSGQTDDVIKAMSILPRKLFCNSCKVEEQKSELSHNQNILHAIGQHSLLSLLSGNITQTDYNEDANDRMGLNRKFVEYADAKTQVINKVCM